MITTHEVRRLVEEAEPHGHRQTPAQEAVNYCPGCDAELKLRTLGRYHLLTLVEALEHIRDYEPQEVAKDEFAYDRMVENFQEAARRGLGERVDETIT